MSLCGNNPALDDIMGKVDEIKGKLAEGMGALGDLEAKANEALAGLQAELPELPSVTSLQGDLAAALGSAQSDFSGALANFQSTWGDKLPMSEIQGYFDQISSAISDPTSLLSFDPCKAFPNKEIDSSTGEVVVKPKVIETPTKKPEKTVDFSQITTMVAGFKDALGQDIPATTITGPSTIDLSQITSSFSPAGTSFGGSGYSEAMKARNKVLKTVTDHFTPIVRQARLAYEKEKKKPEYNQTGGTGINGQGAAKRDRLYRKGKMTAKQVTWYESFLDLEIVYQQVQERRDLIKDQLLVYIEFLTGRVSQENLDKGEKTFKEDPRLVDSDIEMYEKGKAELDKDKDKFGSVGAHTNQVVSSAVQ